MIEIVDLRALVAVVETASFTEAARRLDTTKSVISRRISELEQQLGAPLLDRSARNVRTTEIGAVYYAKCVRLLESFNAANEFVSGFQNQIKGRLYVSVPRLFDEGRIGALFSRFASEHPDVLLHVDHEHTQAAGESHFDVALRLGELQDSSLIARTVGKIGYGLYAGARYAQRRGLPSQPEDVAEHDALLESEGEGRGIWRYQIDDKWHSFRLHERMRSHSIRHLVAAAEAGLGIVAVPGFLAADALAAQRLVPVLPDCVLPSVALSVVYPANRKSSQKVQRFLTFLAEHAAQLQHP